MYQKTEINFRFFKSSVFSSLSGNFHSRNSEFVDFRFRRRTVTGSLWFHLRDFDFSLLAYKAENLNTDWISIYVEVSRSF